MSVERRNQRQAVIEAHHLEGEPKTMARAEGMAAERWPGKVTSVWITRGAPRRHVAVTFNGSTTIERAADTWLAAFRAVDVARQLAKLNSWD
jgi:hypothetical protein